MHNSYKAVLSAEICVEFLIVPLCLRLHLESQIRSLALLRFRGNPGALVHRSQGGEQKF